MNVILNDQYNGRVEIENLEGGSVVLIVNEANHNDERVYLTAQQAKYIGHALVAAGYEAENNDE